MLFCASAEGIFIMKTTTSVPSNETASLASSAKDGRRAFTKTIYLAGGCFWGVDYLMSKMPGVKATKSGYANGTCEADATYRSVCSGKTGFRETVRVSYDPKEVSLERLLFAFFAVIDPEIKNRQGNDVGTQYQTGVYWEPDDAESKAIVERVASVERRRHPLFAVELEPLRNFFAAEEYHQDYLYKNPGGYCHIPFARIEELTKSTVDPALYERPSDERIAESLTPTQRAVTQDAATEPPFRNEFWDFDEPGIYVDVVTGEPLFSSRDKYVSSCGWPAFGKAVEADVVREKLDTSHAMVRQEVRSRAGDSHLGHVFENDPESPTKTRYCINSAALRFIPLRDMESQGYGAYLSMVE